MNSRVKRLLVSVTVSACIDWGLSLYVKSYLITILTVPDFYSTIDTWSMVSVLVDPSVWRMLLVFVSPSPDVVWLGNNRETAHFINIILASVDNTVHSFKWLSGGPLALPETSCPCEKDFCSQTFCGRYLSRPSNFMYNVGPNSMSFSFNVFHRPRTDIILSKLKKTGKY